LKSEQVNAFFRLMDQRYGRVSTIITTKLDYPAWYALFDNKPLVDALLDRLQHHCITIRIDGPSLRASTAGDASAAPVPSPRPKRGRTPAPEAQRLRVFSIMPAHHAKSPLLVVANARHSQAMAALCA